MTEGRLLKISSVQGLEAALRKASSIVRVRNDNQAPSEEARLAFDLTGDKANFTEISYNGDLIAARGKGTVGLNRKLDLSLRAGPIEKMTSLFGKQIGGMIGAVTDQLLWYQITGEIGNAEVKPVVAGGIVQQGGSAVQSGAKAVGEGVGKIGEGIGNLLKPKD
jgi:hypothetical protein